MTTQNTSQARHAWLERATIDLVEEFEEIGFNVPGNIRVSIGWPGGRGAKNKTIGQCWYPAASSDSFHEIFISPRLADTVEILATLAHEIAHTIAGPTAKHGAAFKKVATAIGLEGKMTATHAGQKFADWAHRWMVQGGEYPAGSLNDARAVKQTTRLVKAECGDCGYTVRVTRKWLDEVGAPICPCNHTPMNAE